MNELETLQEIADKCVRCGLCQSVCPVFAELEKETAVARGKVSLIRKVFSGDAEYSGKMSTHLLQCLGCGACSENCPNGVRADELILAARALMVEKKGLSLPKWVIFRKILSSVRLFQALLKTGSLLQGLLLKKIPRESGLRLRFSLPYLDRKRLIPSLANPFFLNRHPQGKAGEEGPKRIGLFVGCSINYLFPDIGESTVRLLKKHSFSIGLPQDQGCCGLPAFGSGDLETARTLARRNLEAFRSLNLGRILVPCASCFYFLKEGYPKLFPGDEEVRSFSEKVMEPSTFFLGRMPAKPQAEESQGQERKLRLTYHDPCHLRRSMKIFQEPRQLLKSLPNVEFIEMKQPDRCCGMGGSFNFIYYDLSKKIMERKLDDIEGTKAEAVTTSCMGCMIQLKDGIHGRKIGTKVLHLVEVLEKSQDGIEK
jgi:glycolate oxidase iron-sulfur subunit